MIQASEFKRGTKIIYKDEPHVVVEFLHVKPGKGGAFVRTKMKNMITGLMHEGTFRSEERFAQPSLEYRTVQYLYEDSGLYNFMDQESFEQFSFNKNQLDDVLSYLKEQETYTVLFWSDRAIAITPATHMILQVIDTPPGVRGDTAQGGATKPATLETGLVVQVPLFVNPEEYIKIDTRDGQYIERVKR
jgi:elongation factor P